MTIVEQLFENLRAAIANRRKAEDVRKRHDEDFRPITLPGDNVVVPKLNPDGSLVEPARKMAKSAVYFPKEMPKPSRRWCIEVGCRNAIETWAAKKPGNPRWRRTVENFFARVCRQNGPGMCDWFAGMVTEAEIAATKADIESEARALKYPKTRPMRLPPLNQSLGQMRYVFVPKDDGSGTRTGTPTCDTCLYMADVGSFALRDAVQQLDQFLEAAGEADGLDPDQLDDLAPFPRFDEIVGRGVKELTALGVMLPPLHPKCRCGIAQV